MLNNSVSGTKTYLTEKQKGQSYGSQYRVYLQDGEAENTEATFRLVQERLTHKKIKKIVIASATGTVRKAMDFFKNQGIKLYNHRTSSVRFLLRKECLSD